MEEYQMESRRICRACLIKDVKMYNMQTSSIFRTYSELTGISDVCVYPYICYECVARLRKCNEFRANCFKAHETLMLMATEKNIQNERKHKHLESPLRLSTLTIIDYPEANVDEPVAEIKTEINEQSTFQHFIKTEEEKLTDDSDTDDNILSMVFPSVASTVKTEELPPVRKRKKQLNKSKSMDDVPLSKLVKTRQKRTVAKPKSCTKKVSKKNTFDPKYFEEYTTVISLTTEDARREVELRKESRNYKDCQYKCDLCYRGYDDQKAYTNHMRKHAKDYGAHECEFCCLRFPKRREYCKHIMICHKRKFICKICPFVCFSTPRANIHISFHKGKLYSCEQCGITFNMPNSLLKHKRDKHPTECVCAICGSTFVTEKGLRAHYALIHKQETNAKQGPQCIECDVHFATETAWKRHLVLSSKHKVSNGCENCGETFLSADSLKSHVKSHARVQRTRVDTSGLPAPCTICQKWLTNRVEFKDHMTSQHPECDVTRRLLAEDHLPCVCEFCGKRFKALCFLVYHRRKHTGEKPYKCDVCDKTFSFPGTFSAHKKSHDGIVKCDMCVKVFKSKSALSKHVKKSHLNLRPHSCDVCGKSFLNPSDVKSHKLHAHEHVPWPKRDRAKNYQQTGFTS